MSEARDWTAGVEAILIERCTACGHRAYFRRGFCATCGSDGVVLEESAGAGTVHAVTEVVRAPSEAFRAHAPYTIVLVDLDEGVRMMAHGAPGLGIGDRVQAGFVRLGETLLPRFGPP